MHPLIDVKCVRPAATVSVVVTTVVVTTASARRCQPPCWLAASASLSASLPHTLALPMVSLWRPVDAAPALCPPRPVQCAVSNPIFLCLSPLRVAALHPAFTLLADCCVQTPLLPPPAAVTSQTLCCHMPQPPPPLTLSMCCHLLLPPHCLQCASC